MQRCYLKLRNYVYLITVKLFDDKVAFSKLKPGVQIHISYIMLLGKVIEILDLAEEGARLLRSEPSVTIHLHDIVHSSIYSDIST